MTLREKFLSPEYRWNDLENDILGIKFEEKCNLITELLSLREMALDYVGLEYLGYTMEDIDGVAFQMFKKQLHESEFYFEMQINTWKELEDHIRYMLEKGRGHMALYNKLSQKQKKQYWDLYKYWFSKVKDSNNDKSS